MSEGDEQALSIDSWRDIYDPARIRCVEDGENFAQQALSVSQGASWLIGDIIRDTCERLVIQKKEHKKLGLPSPQKQIGDIIAAIAVKINKGKRMCEYLRAASIRWSTWEERDVGWLDHTCYIRAMETDDPGHWIEKARKYRWKPNQLQEAYRASKGERHIGNPIKMECRVDKITVEDENEVESQQIVCHPMADRWVSFNPAHRPYEVTFTQLLDYSDVVDSTELEDLET